VSMILHGFLHYLFFVSDHMWIAMYLPWTIGDGWKPDGWKADGFPTLNPTLSPTLSVSTLCLQWKALQPQSMKLIFTFADCCINSPPSTQQWVLPTLNQL
jgi:hypothetical protein